MPDWSQLIIFMTTALVIVLIPGPNTLYIVANSVSGGRTAGIVSSLGVQFGTAFHIAASAFGLSALLASSETAFNAVKYAGAAYLIYLGIKTLLTGKKAEIEAETKPEDFKRIFWRGAVVNLLNPKTALFFFAFLPQFVDQTRGSTTSQIIMLGLILLILGTLSDTIYALAAGSAGNFMRGNPKFLKLQKNFAGFIYLGLGAGTLLTGSSRK
jgi:threonine/homoserine/homoserine lactone efflux protein